MNKKTRVRVSRTRKSRSTEENPKSAYNKAHKPIKEDNGPNAGKPKHTLMSRIMGKKTATTEEQSHANATVSSKSSKRAKKKKPSRFKTGTAGGETIDAPAQNKSTPGKSKTLLATKFVERAVGLGIQGLKAEFMAMKKTPPNPVDHATFLANPQKNRYKDVPCLEATRVKLRGMPSDYVHANYVYMEDSNHRYICAQAPLQLTLADFWCTVLQEECQSILMLCDIMEHSSCKCFQYWNETEGQNISVSELNLLVTTMKASFIDPAQVLKQTMLQVTSPTKNFVVKHIHWCHWPDRGVPKNWEAAFTLLGAVKTDVKPVLIHCSAGIGRTGCIVCIDVIFSRLLHGKSIVDVPELVKALRRQRNNCVQMDSQYLFIHYAMIQKFINGKLIKPDFPGLAKFFETYDKEVIVG